MSILGEADSGDQREAPAGEATGQESNPQTEKRLSSSLVDVAASTPNGRSVKRLGHLMSVMGNSCCPGYQDIPSFNVGRTPS